MVEVGGYVQGWSDRINWLHHARLAGHRSRSGLRGIRSKDPARGSALLGHQPKDQKPESSV